MRFSMYIGSQKLTIVTRAGVAMLFGWLLINGAANAGVVQCRQVICASEFSVSADGQSAGGGQFVYDAETGVISLSRANITGGGMVMQNGGIMWDLGGGTRLSVNSLYGNVDPVLGFSLGASTGAAGKTFAMTFDLPIAISGPIEANSSVSYSLTSTTAAGAKIAPLNGKVVTAFEVDTSVGGLGSLNKGVDVGDTFFFSNGPATSNSQVYTATGTLTGDLAYDLMSVQVAFALSANSAVGISGFVEQVPVPVPAALPLFLVALSGLGGFGQRTRGEQCKSGAFPCRSAQLFPGNGVIN